MMHTSTRAIQDIEDEYLKDDQVVYAILVDRNGYLPTHHRKNSQPLTGDKEKDQVGNRTKRLFNKEVELAAARNTTPFLKQDVSPGYGRADVGSFRAGLRQRQALGSGHGSVFPWRKRRKKSQHLRTQIIGAMLIMLLISSLTIYLVVSWFVRPLLRLTEAARRIADGNLDEEVRVESDDEIGSLAEALNTMTTVIVRNLKGEIEKSSRLITSIKEAIHQLSSSANEMMAISAQQSSGSAEQASAVQEVTTTSEEIAITAKHVMDNARSVETMAEEANQSCTGGHGRRGECHRRHGAAEAARCRASRKACSSSERTASRSAASSKSSTRSATRPTSWR